MGLLEGAIDRKLLGALQAFIVLSVVKIKLIDFALTLRGEPFNSFSIFPKPMLDSVFLKHRVDTEAVLLSVGPISGILAGILPLVDAVAMLFVIEILACVNTAIFPSVNTNAFHVVLSPFTFVTSAV